MTRPDSIGISIAILCLGGWTWACLDHASEARSQSRCMGNLRKIGQALKLYRSDYGDDNPPEISPVGYGCPFRLSELVGTYGLSSSDLHCHSALTLDAVKYRYHIWNEKILSDIPIVAPQLRPLFAQSPLRFPIVADENHMSHRDAIIGPARFLILRLDGRVEEAVRPVRAAIGL
jgi:hypothetical protein